PHRAPFDLLNLFRDVVKDLRQAAPTWQPPPWVEKLQTDPAARGLIECETARKVVAYVGYDDAMNGNEINQLREAVAKDFPRARTVIYKYHVGDVATWAGKRPPLALPVPASQAAAAPAAVLHLTEGDFRPAHAAPRSPGARPPVPVAPPVLGPRALQPHVALFVVDSLETVALERFCDFMLNHVT